MNGFPKKYEDYNFLLMQKIKKKNQWSQQELDLLQEQFPLYSSKKWKRISGVFKDFGFNRSEVECRQKWINFLDPELNKNEWSQSELYKLYEIHDQVGTKWCVIQKYIGRTQNKIKNRFYGTLRNYVRFLVNYFEMDDKCYNFQISKLSPKFLNAMYKAQNQFRFLSEQIRDAIFDMKFKIDRLMLKDRIEARRPVYQRLNTIILKAFRAINNSIKSQEQSNNARQQNVSLKIQPEKSQAVISIMDEPVRAQIKYVQPQQKQGSQNVPIDWSRYYPFLDYPYQNYGSFS